MKLLRIVYISRSSGADAHDIEEILDTARRNNERSGVTGALLVSPTGFVQVLEGPAAAVGDTFERIQCDARHDAITVLALDPMAEHLFPDWSMACVDGAEALSDAGVTLTDLAGKGAAAAGLTLDMLLRAMRGQASRTRTFGTAQLAHLG